MTVRTASFAVAVLAFVTPATAHDLWLGQVQGPNGPEVVVRYGHPGKFEAATTAKLLEMSARASDGSKVSLSPAPRAGDHVPTVINSVPLPGASAVVSATYDNGFWTQTEDGVFRNAAKPMVPGGRDSQWSIKYAKAVTGPDAPWSKAVGQRLEIVPLTEPFGSAEELRVQVLFDGRPLANVEVRQLTDLETADTAKAVGRTAADGTLVVPHVVGRDFLAVAHKVPSSQPALADSDAFSATLSMSGQVLTQ